MRTFTCKYFLSKVAASTAMLIGLLTGAYQPAHAQSCTYWVAPAPTGSDTNPGTSAAPWQTVQKAFNTASAGQTVCFYGGTYPQNPTLQCTTDANGTHCYSQIENNSGSASSPITFTNVSGQVALIQGSTEIHGSYITFQGTPNTTRNCSHADTCGLIFEGSQDTTKPTVNVGICCAGATNPQFVTFDHVEIRNGVYHAGLYEEGCNNAFTGSYVHDNGVSVTDSNHTVDNGIYWSSLSPGCTNGGLIANNIVEHNWSKGIQLYCGDTCTNVQHVTVEENTVVNNDAQGIVVLGIK